MATPATRMMLFKNGKSFPLHLLRGSLLGGSNNITSQFISDPALFQPQQKPIFNLLGGQSNAGLVSDVNGALNWRFGRFFALSTILFADEIKHLNQTQQSAGTDNNRTFTCSFLILDNSVLLKVEPSCRPMLFGSVGLVKF
ncbi:hypothetical protein POTOM_003060 [Populus tomentosa]|uniref:Uncharacterized protein n=1 Tax=Populus tomentosa TaxID=118781 RepID=A0A8X8DL32_POPTO|nr:hypothetical protein POTOM_003060 [Populus tomentosa]